MQRPGLYCLIAIRTAVKLAVMPLAALFLAAMPGAARAETPAGCATPPSNELVAYRCKFYDGDIASVVARAREWIKWRAPYVHNPALVLDIDETSLSNWKVLYQNQFVFVFSGPCSFREGTICGALAWERMAVAPAIRPTRDLFDLAKAEHVTVFFVTGRAENAIERAATETNLHRAGYAGWKHLYLRSKEFAGDPSVAPYKTSARAKIEAQGYTIIANVGDQWSDLENGCAERAFKLPNPFYTIP